MKESIPISMYDASTNEFIESYISMQQAQFKNYIAETSVRRSALTKNKDGSPAKTFSKKYKKMVYFRIIR